MHWNRGRKGRKSLSLLSVPVVPVMSPPCPRHLSGTQPPQPPPQTRLMTGTYAHCPRLSPLSPSRNARFPTPKVHPEGCARHEIRPVVLPGAGVLGLFQRVEGAPPPPYRAARRDHRHVVRQARAVQIHRSGVDQHPRPDGQRPAQGRAMHAQGGAGNQVVPRPEKRSTCPPWRRASIRAPHQSMSWRRSGM